jgi:hypothetical protein
MFTLNWRIISGPLLFLWIAKNIPPAKFYHIRRKFTHFDSKAKPAQSRRLADRPEPLTNPIN